MTEDYKGADKKPSDNAIPTEVTEAFARAFQALSEAIGLEKATKIILKNRDHISDFLKPETIRIINATEGITADEIEELVREKRKSLSLQQSLNEPIETQTITATDVQPKMRLILDGTVNGKSFIVTRKNKETAIIVPYNDAAHCKLPNTLTSADFLRKRGKFLKLAHSGISFIVTRDGTREAVLGPLPPEETRFLSIDDRKKLIITSGFSPEIVAQAIAIVRGKITVIDLLLTVSQNQPVIGENDLR